MLLTFFSEDSFDSLFKKLEGFSLRKFNRKVVFLKPNLSEPGQCMLVMDIWKKKSLGMNSYFGGI